MKITHLLFIIILITYQAFAQNESILTFDINALSKSNEKNIFIEPTSPNATFSIDDVSWSNQIDQDLDTYTRSRRLILRITASEATFTTLRIWTDNGGGNVVYFDYPSDGSGFLLPQGTADYYLDGFGTVSLCGSELPHEVYDISIFLRQWPDGTTLAYRFDTDDADLNNEKFETAAEDIQPNIRVNPTSLTINDPAALRDFSRDPYQINLKNRQIVPSINLEDTSSLTTGEYFLLQFDELPTITELDGYGIKAINFINKNTIMGFISNAVSSQALKKLRWHGKLLASDKISKYVTKQLNERTGNFTFLVYGHTNVLSKNLSNLITSLGGSIINHLSLPSYVKIVRGDNDVFSKLSTIREIAWIMDASPALLKGDPVYFCPGAMTAYGPVGEYVLHDDGWDGPGLGSVELTYFFINGTPDISGDDEQTAVVNGLLEWTKYADITFSQALSSGQNQSFDIMWASGDHGDGDPFDGPGNVLAHCFYPHPPNSETIAGDMHFDEDETWSLTSNYHQFSVALHEAGHGLGLGHSDDPNAVMYAFYQQVTGLQADDIAGIQAIYAPASNANTFTIFNDGQGVLTISSISDNKGWLTTSGFPSTPFNIVAGGSQIVTCNVDWNQLSSQETGAVTINSNDPDEPSVQVSVTAIPDLGDGNDDPTTATVISSIPHTGNYEINPEGDIDWYRLNLTINTAYTIANSSSSNYDSELWLYGPGNSGGTDVGLLVANNDDYGGSLQPRIDYTPTSSGYYFLRIADYSNNPAGSLRKEAKTSSILATGTYTLNITEIPVETVATPTFSPASGTQQPVNVTISCTTPDAVIHYTENGSDPTESSPVYSTPITLSSTTEVTLKAKAWKIGMNASLAASANYPGVVDGVPLIPVTTSETVQKGQDFWVDIQVGDADNPVTDLKVITFDMNYTNTAIIDYVTDEIGPFITSAQKTVLTDDPNGSISASVYRTSGGNSGFGVILRIKFNINNQAIQGQQITFSFLSVQANDASGNLINITPQTKTVTVIEGATVWPGDANNNATVNLFDINPIIIYYGLTGPVRPNASDNWAPQISPFWTPPEATYADCNGNGTINLFDINTVIINYGQTQTSNEPSSDQPKFALADPPLEIVGPVSAVSPGDIFELLINIGSVSLPVTDVKVVTFELSYTQTIFVDYVDYSLVGSFITGGQATVISDDSNGLLTASVYRTSGGNSGFGTIIKFRFQSLPSTPITTTVEYSFGSIQANRSDGTLQPLSPVGTVVELPVELTSFTASASANNNIILKWETATEINNYGFDVERKTNDGEWGKIGFLTGNGNSSSPKRYSYVDNNLFGGSKFQYRLKQIDNDGRYTYSKEIEIEAIPDKYDLLQNYPNPFNPITNIEFQILKPGLVKIKIYDILGNEVATLVNKELEIGYYKCQWNANGVSSGVYFYQIQTVEFVSTKKLLLTK